MAKLDGAKTMNKLRQLRRKIADLLEQIEAGCGPVVLLLIVSVVTILATMLQY